jgi:hypothetical protein
VPPSLESLGMIGILQPTGSDIVESSPVVARWDFHVLLAADVMYINVSGYGNEPPMGVALARGLWSLYWRRPVQRVVLDLSDLKFLGPQVTLELVLFYRWIGKRGAVVRLCGLSRKQLQSSRLYRWFCYYPNPKAAAHGDWPIRRPR